MNDTREARRAGARAMTAERLTRVKRARAGDLAAFDLLAAEAVDGLYRVARLVLRATDIAEDAVQETLVRCWRDLPALRDPDRFDAWLRRLLTRAITDEFRRGRRARASITLLRIEPATPDASESGWLAGRASAPTAGAPGGVPAPTRGIVPRGSGPAGIDRSAERSAGSRPS